ncbi:MAG: ERCC4 domain-containing protein [Candidatus Bathyarchaeia archaeon]
MRLLVDHRERGLMELLKDVCDEVALTQLPIADYLLISDSDAVAIERKTITDFLSSVRSNRLWDQLLRMMKTENVLGYRVKRRILVVHGNFQEHFEMLDPDWSERDLLVHWSQLMGAYMEIIYVYNTPIIHAESDTAFKAFMRILAKRESAGMNDKLPEARWYRKPARADLPVKDRKKYILSSLPYIGDRLAENLLLRFSTISAVACATIDELQETPKIGRKKAELIYRMFHS